MQWEVLKQKLMHELERAKRNGSVDESVVKYLMLINSVPECATSSSCYGRMLLIDVPTESKRDSKFIKKWHEETEFYEIWNMIKEATGKHIWFKMEPLILHISCKDLKTAKRLLNVKNLAGIKRGGIFSISDDRVQVELEGTQRIALPVKIEDRVIVSEDYMKIVVDDANNKMKKNRERWKRFERAFIDEFMIS